MKNYQISLPDSLQISENELNLIIAKELYSTRRITKETAAKTAGINIDSFSKLFEEKEFIESSFELTEEEILELDSIEAKRKANDDDWANWKEMMN